MFGHDMLLKNVLRPLGQDLIGVLARAEIVEPLLSLIAADVRELDESGNPGPLSSGYGRLTALALSPDQFRGDLEALAARPEMRVLRMPLRWQTRLLYSFYEVGTKSPQVHRPPHGSRAARSQAVYRKFLRVFQQYCPPFLRYLGSFHPRFKRFRGRQVFRRPCPQAQACFFYNLPRYGEIVAFT